MATEGAWTCTLPLQKMELVSSKANTIKILMKYGAYRSVLKCRGIRISLPFLNLEMFSSRCFSIRSMSIPGVQFSSIQLCCPSLTQK